MHPQSLTKVPGQTYRSKDSGELFTNVHFLISRYLTHTYHPTRGFSSLPAMPIMNKSNGACMSRGSMKLSWHPSSTTGGMGKSATVFYGRLADRNATKTKQPYSSTCTWIQCRLNFSLIRSLVSCLRWSRHNSCPRLPDSTTLLFPIPYISLLCIKTVMYMYVCTVLCKNSYACAW